MKIRYSVLILCLILSFSPLFPVWAQEVAPAAIPKMKPVIWAADLHRSKNPADRDTYYAATSDHKSLIISTAPLKGKGGGVIDNLYPVTVTDNDPHEQDQITVDDFFGSTLNIVVDHVWKTPGSAEARAKDAVQYYIFITPTETEKVVKDIGPKVGYEEFIYIRNRFNPDKYMFH